MNIQINQFVWKLGLSVLPISALNALPASAQVDPRNLPVPTFSMNDNIGVDLQSGRLNYDSDSISITTGGISTKIYYSNILEVPRKSFEGWLRKNVSEVSQMGGIREHIVEIGPKSYVFRTERSGPYIPVTPFSGTLAPENGKLVYTDLDGTKITFSSNSYYDVYPIDNIVYRSGELRKFYYLSGSITPSKVLSSRGWGLNISGNIITLFSRSKEYCPATAEACHFSKNWPTISSSTDVDNSEKYITSGYGEIKVQGRLSGSTRVNFSDSRPPILLTYGTTDAQSGRIINATINGINRSYTYNYTKSGNDKYIGEHYVESIDENGAKYSGYSCNGSIYYLKNPLGHRNTYYYNNSEISIEPNTSCNSFSRWDAIGQYPTRYKTQEGNSFGVIYTGDWRVSEVINYDKSQSLIIRHVADYASKYDPPTMVTDPNLNKTDFTYENGNVTRETLPPVDGVRYVRRFEYDNYYSKIKTLSGDFVNAETAISLLSHERSCQKTETIRDSCAGGVDDEVTTSYYYNSELNISEKSITSKSTTHWICYKYDDFGNVISFTNPTKIRQVCQ